MATSKSPAPRPSGGAGTPRGASNPSRGAGSEARARVQRKPTSTSRPPNKIGIEALDDVFKAEGTEEHRAYRSSGGEKEVEREEIAEPSSFSPDNKHREPMIFSHEESQRIKVLFKEMSEFVKKLVQISSDNIASPLLKEIANEGAVKRLKEYEKEIAHKIFIKTLREVEADKKSITIEMLYENQTIKKVIDEQLTENDINIKNPDNRTKEHILNGMKEEQISLNKIKIKMFEETTILAPILDIMEKATKEKNNIFSEITKEIRESPFFSEDVLSTF